ncbi:MAG TPA: hypothetical protein VFF73_24290 [Planctomycetota bacterium]|nr:hypothetical protein [Planctomycetota bacterium]
MSPGDLDPIFARAREPVPPGLADRVLAALDSGTARELVEGADRARAIRAAIRISLVLFAISAIVFAAIFFGSAVETPANEQPATPTIDDELVSLARSEPAVPLWPRGEK